MRVAVATANDRRVGGVESYAEALLEALAADGHEVALWHEPAPPTARERIAVPVGTAVASLDARTAEEAVRRWRPDAIVVNGLADPEVEATLMRHPGAVFVAHNYHGVCISGTRAWSNPVVRPCDRRFGPACLAHYLPRRCGGRSVVTMTRLYARERQRQLMLRSAPTVVTLSSYVRDVYVRHGWEPAQVVHLPFGFGRAPGESREAPGAGLEGGDGALRLAGAGRLEPLKGFHLLLEALPLVRQLSRRRVVLTVVGDGTARESLERQAAQLAASDADLEISFTGWLVPAERDRRLNDAALLVLPSAWPEPLGLVGDEAGALGLPVVAFDVGGVPEWLVDGENGRLVRADPPAAAPLARAIADLGADPSALARLSEGARRLAGRHSPAAHARMLIQLLEHLRDGPPTAARVS